MADVLKMTVSKADGSTFSVSFQLEKMKPEEYAPLYQGKLKQGLHAILKEAKLLV